MPQDSKKSQQQNEYDKALEGLEKSKLKQGVLNPEATENLQFQDPSGF